MNKKLLFGIMSLAALAACTNDDFETQNGAQVSEQVSPIQFEVINNAEVTRASMPGNSIVWSAAEGDLFTLYHGVNALTDNKMTGYENATYKASEGEGGAVLTTPSVIKKGFAVMVWPADTTFYKATSEKLTVKIPETLENVENNIPYASDLLNIEEYKAYSETPANPEEKVPTAYKTAGKDRKYAVYMRPMASQLILKADYAGTDAVINELTKGSDPIDPIALTSVDIVSPTKKLTKEIDLIFKDKTAYDPAAGTNWATVENNVWSKVTDFDLTSVVNPENNKLSTKCINGIESAKFLILPQAASEGVLTGAYIVVNTIYGKVELTAANYEDEINSAWYRYAASADDTYGETAGTGSDAGKVKTSIEKGLAQVIDKFSTNKTTKATSVVVNEPTGAVGTRYVKVLLTKLDMNGLHVKSDKQLYDAVRVWKEIGKGSVTVNLDGDAKTGEFEISQKTIAKINEINAALAEEETVRSFSVQPCKGVEGEKCNTIVITGGGEIPADLTFIKKNTVADNFAAVALNKGESWKWNSKNVMVDKAATGVSKIINRGTLVSDANATLKIFDNSSEDPKNPHQINTIPFENALGATWNINAVLYVQFDVTNYGTVNIAKGAEYLQSATGNIFTNEATTLPERFFMNDPSILDGVKAKFVEQIGVVNNKGVFAAVSGATINNYGLIEHADEAAKTIITANQKTAVETPFAVAFNDKATMGGANDNKMGRINLPYSNKDENDISISASAAKGFVSVTVTSENAPADKKLNATAVGTNVNYVIINSGIKEITDVSDKVKYIEFNDKDNTEITWKPRYNEKTGAKIPYEYDGLVVFSPVNIELNAIVKVSQSVYIAASMYVSGDFKKGDTTVTSSTEEFWTGYFGDTEDNADTMYKTFGAAGE